MDTLIIQPGVAIAYNTDFLDSAAIQRFAASNAATATLAQAHAIQQSLRVEPYELDVITPVVIAADEAQDETTTIEHVLDAFAQDEEFADSVKQQREQLLQETQTAIRAAMLNPINPTLIAANRSSLHVERVFVDQRVSYRIDGTPVLEFDRALLNETLGLSLEMLLAWTSLIWDGCTFLSSCFDIWLPKSDAAAVRTLSNEVSKEVSSWQRFVNGMKKLKDAVKPSDKVQHLIDAFKVAKKLVDVIKAILCKSSLWQKIKVALQFVACVALLFVSAGTSLVLKLIKMAAELGYVIADVINILQLEGVVTQPPPRAAAAH